MLKRNTQTGFTIIEVVLVLAIAGLIFLAVFIALPQLQRSQRDSTRKSDAGRLVAAINQYATNENNGVAPADTLELETVRTNGYIDDFEYGFSTASGYTVANGWQGTSLNDAVAANGELIAYLRGRDCDDNATSKRSFIVVAPQENGLAYCTEG